MDKQELKKLKILDLCSGTRSVEKAFSKTIIDYKGVDIYSPEKENIILDLATNTSCEDLIEKLGDWKPDFIWASPVCNKFSLATTGPKGNSYFILDDNKIRVRQLDEYKYVKHNKMNEKKDLWSEYKESAIIAVKLFENIKKIVEYYNVPFIIENPANALSRYILPFERNICNYCMYGFEYPKRTCLYSNEKIELKKCDGNHEHISFAGKKGERKPKHWNPNISVYANRSSVPPSLIREAVFQLMKNRKDIY